MRALVLWLAAIALAIGALYWAGESMSQAPRGLSEIERGQW